MSRENAKDVRVVSPGWHAFRDAYVAVSMFPMINSPAMVSPRILKRVLS
jgi:hypothetical protein